MNGRLVIFLAGLAVSVALLGYALGWAVGFEAGRQAVPKALSGTK